MVTDNVRQLLERLNDRLANALETAAGYSISRGHYQVTIEHLLLKLLDSDDQGDLAQIFAHFDVEMGAVQQALQHQLEEFRTGNTGRPQFSPTLLQVVESAFLVSSVHHDLSEVRSGTLLEAMLNSDELKAESYMDVLRPISRDELREQFADIVDGSTENAAAGTPGSATFAGGEDGDGSALSQFTINLTEEARNGEIDPIFGRSEEIRQIIDILNRRQKNNPILVGEAGVGKTAVVEGLALRIADKEVPETLHDLQIRNLDLGLLKAGAGVKGEFEERLKTVIQEVQDAAKPTVLFIDEAHTLIGAGGSEGTGDAANLLKPALARGELRTIAATTWAEYKKYIEKDPALERRFQMVKIEEPSVEDTALILRGLKPVYEDHHGVQITDEAVDATAELAGRFITGRQLPDKAVDLLDTAAARVKTRRTSRPGRLDDLDRRIQNLDIEIEGVERDVAAGLREADIELDQLQQERADLVEERAALESQWEQEKELVARITKKRDAVVETARAAGGDGQADASASEDDTSQDELQAMYRQLADLQEESPMVHTEVNEQIAAEVVSDWTGIPVGNMLKDEADLLLNLEDRLGTHILGQDGAIQEVSEAVRTSKADLGDPNSPLGVFLFVGPSGVGKTETALRLADLLFGGERFLTTINMSEYQEKHTAAQLKGSPPGYVGYGEGGVLTEAVRQRPYSVVLLDEVEKAHRDVMNLFYQVFDKGFMRDGEGREIDFRNTIIIMTSNLASEEITNLARGKQADGTPDLGETVDAGDVEDDESIDEAAQEAMSGAGDEGETPSLDQIRDAIHPMLVQHFQPALLGRMRVVPYLPLDTETMRGITEIKLGNVGDRLAEAHDIDFAYAPSVVDRIAARCTQVDAGARNIDSIIDRTVLPEAARALIRRMADDDQPERLTLDIDEEGGFTYAFD